MLYNILTVVLAFYLMAIPLFVMSFIKFGMRIAENPEKASKPTTVIVKKRKPKLTAEEKKILDDFRILDRNLDIYDGTGIGQEEIKHGNK